jgi:hypothetical protein
MGNSLARSIGLARKNSKGKKVVNWTLDSTIELQTRKPKQPNWEHDEIVALIKAKKNEHVASMHKTDGWN